MKTYKNNGGYMKTKSWILPGIVLVFLFMLAGCASTAHIEKDSTVDFKQYKTYAWIETPKDKKQSSSDIMESKVKAIVNDELAKTAGWREVNAGQKADLLLSYDILVERSVRQQNDPVYSQPYLRTFYNPRARRYFNVYYPSRFVGYDNYAVDVQEGTVTISMIDTRTDKTVWQGWTTEQIDSRRIKSREVETAVKSIFRKFDLAKN